MRESFKQQLIASGYVHHLLKPNREKSTEARQLRKKVCASRPLWDGRSLSVWTKHGVGEIALNGECLRMNAPSRQEPESPMPHYTGFSAIKAAITLSDEDWRGYNRMRCKVKPGCDGFHAPFLTMTLVSDGEIKIPDAYHREGFHVINLINNEWNECVWEFPDLPRDCVTEFAFTLDCHGKELFGGDTFVFDIRDIVLECVIEPDASLGWQGTRNTVSFSTTGYWCEGEKTAVLPYREGDFALIREDNGQTVYTGSIKPLINEKGRFGLIDFTAFTEAGRYRLQTGTVTTESFAIDAHVMEEAVWKAVNFIYAERCGFPVSGGHSFCHSDITATHNGLTMPYCGGWHDAGDVSQQTAQTAEVAHALFELSLRVKDCDTLLYRRLVEEARWGLDFTLRTRFGDGYRATSAGMSRWTNVLTGDGDDEPARVHNRSFDNFLMSGVEAFAGYALREEDPELAWVCINAAKEDYGFALRRFEEVGMETRFEMEHTHNASLSLYYAVASWAASQVFMACGEAYYAVEARRFGDKLLSCQDNGEADLPFTGFFYRDEAKQTIVHFNHQSREHLFIQALCALCNAKDNTPEQTAAYENALRRYGDYLKAMYAYSAPYGMLPAGVHAYGEENDRETFPLLHVMTTYAADKENYAAQLRSGTPLNDRFCLRHFPVWFSFRGNAAVQLSAAKAASLIGLQLKDEALTAIARDQLYWLAGKNPFGQSMMYGEGSNYAQQYAALAGETMGEMPVGIQTRANEDQPYWPMANNATYKEIWMSTVGHWLWVVADVY